ncbi:TrmH family RNA methyltransferase [Thermopirellula anaerolimosa]
MTARPFEPIRSIDDPRVAPYRNLPERTLRGEAIFIAEGWFVTERLLQSEYACESVLMAADHVEEFAHRIPESIPLYVGDRRLLYDVVGYKFHQGILAVGRRKPFRSAEALFAEPRGEEPIWIVCPEVTKPENLGLVFRSAAAFGVSGVLLGERCCDPFTRRALRVSMGAVTAVPIAKSGDLHADLKAVRGRFGVHLAAAVLSESAVSLPDFACPFPCALMLGHETEGLDAWLNLCDSLVTIPMSPDVDSLNLGVAAGVFLYEFRRGGLSRRA